MRREEASEVFFFFSFAVVREKNGEEHLGIYHFNCFFPQGRLGNLLNQMTFEVFVPLNLFFFFFPDGRMWNQFNQLNHMLDKDS
jgi:hypothetical protein